MSQVFGQIVERVLKHSLYEKQELLTILDALLVKGKEILENQSSTEEVRKQIETRDKGWG